VHGCDLERRPSGGTRSSPGECGDAGAGGDVDDIVLARETSAKAIAAP
jgi:hypothetical protein